jgi:hypothetical protein
VIHCEECYHAAGLDFFCNFLGEGHTGRGGRGTPSSQNGKQVSYLPVAILISDKLFWIFSPFSWWGPMVGKVPMVRSFDTDTHLLIVSANLFTNFINNAIASSLQTGSFRSDTIASSIEIC